MKAVSPEGNEITGTLEVIDGVALAEIVLVNGHLKIEYLGETQVDWNTQSAKLEKGERLLVCSAHKVWRESQVTEATRKAGEK
jgi:hypothetical protein